MDGAAGVGVADARTGLPEVDGLVLVLDDQPVGLSTILETPQGGQEQTTVRRGPDDLILAPLRGLEVRDLRGLGPPHSGGGLDAHRITQESEHEGDFAEANLRPLDESVADRAEHVVHVLMPLFGRDRAGDDGGDDCKRTHCCSMAVWGVIKT